MVPPSTRIPNSDFQAVIVQRAHRMTAPRNVGVVSPPSWIRWPTSDNALDQRKTKKSHPSWIRFFPVFFSTRILGRGCGYTLTCDHCCICLLVAWNKTLAAWRHGTLLRKELLYGGQTWSWSSLVSELIMIMIDQNWSWWSWLVRIDRDHDWSGMIMLMIGQN